MALARFLHTADIHLSRPFGFLPPQLAEERRRDQRRVLTKISDLALEHEVDIVLIAGDLFDSTDPDPTDMEAVTTEFSRLGEAGKRIFVIPGNHDYISANSFWHRLNIVGFHVFTEHEWDKVVLDDLGIAVSGIAFHRAKSDRRAFDGLELPADIPSIVMAHASYEFFEGQLDRYHPFSTDDIPGASYIALGHYHRFNAIPAGTSICYPGTPEGISFDSPETEDRYVVIGEIDDGGKAQFEPVKVNRRTMRSTEIDCTSFESQSGLFDTVRKFCEPNALVELVLTGAPTCETASILEELPDRFRESCYYLSLNSSGLLLPMDLPADDRTIRGRFCKHLISQIADSTDPERTRLLRRALELGLAAFSEG